MKRRWSTRASKASHRRKGCSNRSKAALPAGKASRAQGRRPDRGGAPRGERFRERREGIRIEGGVSCGEKFHGCREGDRIEGALPVGKGFASAGKASGSRRRSCGESFASAGKVSGSRRRFLWEKLRGCREGVRIEGGASCGESFASAGKVSGSRRRFLWEKLRGCREGDRMPRRGLRMKGAP
ncbi:hypothetical protein EP10_001939 [Geobacillus icigianus]|uniref:Uncharacterized protein n=1 Tax=Geobacillus icigianus TaxID=1430331 RepID=A0ABU6BI98_9BACL|nr:hypothetical protein [Geobacillus icigianus]